MHARQQRNTPGAPPCMLYKQSHPPFVRYVGRGIVPSQTCLPFLSVQGNCKVSMEASAQMQHFACPVLSWFAARPVFSQQQNLATRLLYTTFPEVPRRTTIYHALIMLAWLLAHRTLHSIQFITRFHPTWPLAYILPIAFLQSITRLHPASLHACNPPSCQGQRALRCRLSASLSGC